MATEIGDLRAAMEEGRNVRVAALARAAGVTSGALYGAIQRGEIRAVRIGKAIRIPPAEARRLLGLDEKAA